MTYAKPLLTPVNPETETCGCTIFVRPSQEVFVKNTNQIPSDDGGIKVDPRGAAEAIQNNTIVGVDSDGGFQVTPLANTGLPGTQPIIIGVPVGVTGVSLAASLKGGVTFDIQLCDLGLYAFGGSIPLTP